MVNPRPWDVLLANGATRIPLTLAADQAGRLAYQVDEETAGEKVRLLWEQGEFSGGMGQQFVRSPDRYLMGHNVDTSREQGFRLAPAITYTDQGASPYTVRAGTPEIRSSQFRPTLNEIAYVTVASALADVLVGGRVTFGSTANHILGFTVRWSATNSRWRVELNQNTGQLRLVKIDTGVETVVGTFAMTISANTQYLLQVNMSGSTWNVYVDGVLRIGPTTDAFNSTATQHGPYTEGAVSGQGIDEWWVEGFVYDGFDGSADGTALTSHRPSFNRGMTVMIEFSSSLYLADNLNVYRFDGTNWLHRFTATRPAETLQTVFDLQVYGANIYVARGSNPYYYSGNGNTWTGSTFALGWWPYVFTVLRDTLFGVSVAGALRSSTNPVNGGTWTAVIATLGDSAYDVNDLETWGDLVVVGKDDGVWTTDISGLIYHLTPALRLRGADSNARGLLPSFDGHLYVPLREMGLWRLSLDGDYQDVSLRQQALSLMLGVGTLNSLQVTVSNVNLAEDDRWVYLALNGYILRGRLEQKGWRWQSWLSLWNADSVSADDFIVISPLVSSLVTGQRLYFEEPGLTMTSSGSRRAYRIGYVPLTSESAFATKTSFTQEHSLITSGWDGGPGLRHRNKSFHRLGVMARNVSGTRPLRVDYALDFYNGMPLTASWTQLQNASGAATTITAEGYTELYFPADVVGRNVFLRFLLQNDATATSPEVLWFTLYGRVQQDQRRTWTFTARLSRGVRGGRNAGPMADPGGILTDLRTARNAANPVTLTDLDGTTTYRADVVSVRQLSVGESSRFQAVGQDRFVQVLLAEAVAN